MATSSFVGTFYVPTVSEQENIVRTYMGYGDPNLLDVDYFQPHPRVGDKYLQLDADPIVEWVYTQYGIWIEIGLRYDSLPPDNTDIMDII